MKRVNVNLQNIKLKRGELLVIYRGTSKVKSLSMVRNTVAIKGNINRDKVVREIFYLIVDKF